jgi:hypothetical protein
MQQERGPDMRERDEIRHIQDIREFQENYGPPDVHAIMLEARRQRADAIAEAMSRCWDRLRSHWRPEPRPRPLRNRH